MNVLVCASRDYPDQDAVRKRLERGLQTDHVTFCHRSDSVVPKLIEELGGEVRILDSTAMKESIFSDSDGYANLCCLLFDRIIVYHTKGSGGFTKYFAEEATKSIERDPRNSRLPDNGQRVMRHKGKIELIETKR